MIPQLFAIYAGRPHFQPPERNKERSGEPQQGNISPCLYRLSLSWLAFIGSVGGTLGRNICFGVFWRHISGAIYETVSRRLIVKAPSATLYAPFDGGLFRSQELVCVALLLHRSVTASTRLSCAFKPDVLRLTAEISCDFDHRLVLFALTAQIWRVVIKLLFVCLNVMIYKA